MISLTCRGGRQVSWLLATAFDTTNFVGTPMRQIAFSTINCFSILHFLATYLNNAIFQLPPTTLFPFPTPKILLLSFTPNFKKPLRPPLRIIYSLAISKQLCQRLYQYILHACRAFIWQCLTGHRKMQ